MACVSRYGEFSRVVLPTAVEEIELNRVLDKLFQEPIARSVELINRVIKCDGFKSLQERVSYDESLSDRLESIGLVIKDCIKENFHFATILNKLKSVNSFNLEGSGIQGFLTYCSDFRGKTVDRYNKEYNSLLKFKNDKPDDYNEIVSKLGIDEPVRELSPVGVEAQGRGFSKELPIEGASRPAASKPRSSNLIKSKSCPDFRELAGEGR